MTTARIIASHVEYAASDGSACQAKTFCRGTYIPGNSLRWAMKEEGKDFDVYYHWGCGNGNMVNALSKTKYNGYNQLFPRDQLRVIDAIEAVPPKEVSKSATPPKIDLPPPSKLKDMDHLVATLETVGVGATHFPQKPDGGKMRLEREHGNNYDPNSIAIFNEHGQIGHLPAYCSVRLASLVDNSVLALQVQPEVYDSNCSGGSESAVRVGIFCVKEHRDIIATALQRLRFKPVQRAILTVHPLVDEVKSEPVVKNAKPE